MSFIEAFFKLSLISQIIILYLIAINIITFFYFGVDKIKSQLDFWRISEKILWILTLIGGSVGALGGMYFFNHKTSKHSFQAVIILILLVHISATMLIFSNLLY
ncbi:MAG: DUF1294 domain-containing protein [Candidatus Magasanikbacteria bacterium]